MTDKSYANPPGNASPWLAFIVVAAATFLGGAVLVGFVVWENVSSATQPVTRKDRQVLLTAGYLENWVDGLLIQSSGESLRKVEHKDGAVELAYSYRHPEKKMRLSLRCTVLVHLTPEAAQQAYQGFRARGRRSLRDVEPQIVFGAPNQGFRYGDDSEYSILKVQDSFRGVYFVCRANDRLYRVELYGDQLSENVSFPEVIEPLLENLENYKSK